MMKFSSRISIAYIQFNFSISCISNVILVDNDLYDQHKCSINETLFILLINDHHGCY